MKQSIYYFIYLFVVLPVFMTGCDQDVNSETFDVWVLHSYEEDCPWMEEMNRGIVDGFRDNHVKVNLRIDYLNSYYSKQQSTDSALAYLNRIEKPDLILTVNDQATAAVINSHHPFTEETNGANIVFCGVNCPDSLSLFKLGLSHVTGFSTRLNMEEALGIGGMLKRIKIYIPFTCNDMSSIALGKIKGQLQKISHTVVTLKVDTVVDGWSYHDVYYKMIEERFQTFGVLPGWDPFVGMFINTSATPFIAINNIGFGQGVLGGYFTSSYDLAYDGARHAADILTQERSSFKIQESAKKLWIDWAVYDRFNFSFESLPDDVEFINMPFFVKYHLLLQIVGLIGIVLLTSLLIVAIYRMKLYRDRRIDNERKLIQQRDNLLVITDSINEGIITIDEHGLIRSANLRARQLLRVESDFLNTPFSDWVTIYDPAIGKEAGKVFHAKLKEKMSVSFSPMARIESKKNGHYFLIKGELAPLIIKGEVKGAICVFADRTDEFTTGEYLSLTTDVGQLFFWWFDFHKKRLLVDPSFFTIWGIEDDGTHTLSVDTVLSFFSPQDIEEWQAFYEKQRFSNNLRVTREVRMNLNGTSEQYWEIRMSYHQDSEDALPLLYGLCINIQDYKNKQALLQEARDNVHRSEQLKSAFLSNMSHEIRTPLNGIIGFAKLIASNEDYEAEDYELFINTIQLNCNLLLALIDDILDLARIDSGNMIYTDANCNLNSLIIQVMTTQQVILQKPLQLIRKLPTEPVFLMVDPLRLNQVITNLVNNAVKFTKEGSITVGYTSDEKNVYITVTDTGIGIPPEEQNLIFDRFYKKHDDIQGAGIGLSLCKNIVEHYGGVLSVASEVGKGTTFTVTLPLK